MKTRLIDNATDYPIVEPWWIAHQGVTVPANILPPVGVMALDDDGTPVAAGWLYMAVGVGLAWISWGVTNPAHNPMHRLRGLSAVVGGLEAIAVTHDYHVIFTETKIQAFARWFCARGYVKNHTGITQLFKRI